MAWMTLYNGNSMHGKSTVSRFNCSLLFAFERIMHLCNEIHWNSTERERENDSIGIDAR